MKSFPGSLVPGETETRPPQTSSASPALLSGTPHPIPSSVPKRAHALDSEPKLRLPKKADVEFRWHQAQSTWDGLEFVPKALGVVTIYFGVPLGVLLGVPFSTEGKHLQVGSAGPGSMILFHIFVQSEGRSVALDCPQSECSPGPHVGRDHRKVVTMAAIA